jgi:hypothetical protein
MSKAGAAPTWETVLSVARQLESSARAGWVSPAEGARLVTLILDFQDHVSGPVSTQQRTSSAPPRGVER